MTATCGYKIRTIRDLRTETGAGNDTHAAADVQLPPTDRMNPVIFNVSSA